jgi:hypothetical protein
MSRTGDNKSDKKSNAPSPAGTLEISRRRLLGSTTSGQMDNTLIIFMVGDNGASAEGSLQGTTNEVAISS